MKKDLEILKEALKGTKGMTLVEVSKFLKWSLKKKKENRDKLDRWVESGDLYKNKNGKYLLETFLEKGVLTIVKDRFAFVDTKEEGIYIRKEDFGGGLNGDTVLVKISKKGENGKKSEGKVVKVVERASNKVIGIFERNDNFGFVKPTHSFGRDIYIPKGKMKGARDKELVAVEVTNYGGEGKKPEGMVIEILGDPFNSTNMIEALIIRNNLSNTFPTEVLREAMAIEDTIPKEEYKKRKDLRDLDIITIDGADAKDLDDAVYVEKLEDGRYKLIVSIADVSHYVREGSLLDKEASSRGNSVYLVDRVLPMFPKELSNGICSLNPNEDKVTFTCEMIIDEDGRVVDHDVYKSIINTTERMTYDDVNKILEGDSELGKRYENIKSMLETMYELSKIIRKDKHSRGSIDFDIPEIKVELDEKKKVKALVPRDRGEAERIIEDFMIKANETVAENIFWMEIPSIYRTHDKPDPERIEDLNEMLSKFKYRIHSFEDLHPKKFQSIIEDSKERDISMIVHKAILRSLKQARYTKENTGHFGLASSYYTHFTSPIRRYADLMVHRILSLTLNYSPNLKTLKKLSESLDETCEVISKTERDAMKAEDESIKIKVVEYMMDKIGEVFEGKIIGFSPKKIFIETKEHVEVAWDIVEESHYYEFSEKDYQMVNKDTGEVYLLGQEMEIMIVKADMLTLEIFGVKYTKELDETFKRYK